MSIFNESNDLLVVTYDLYNNVCSNLESKVRFTIAHNSNYESEDETFTVEIHELTSADSNLIAADETVYLLSSDSDKEYGLECLLFDNLDDALHDSVFMMKNFTDSFSCKQYFSYSVSDLDYQYIIDKVKRLNNRLYF